MTISPTKRGTRALSTEKSKAIPAITCTAASSMNASAIWRVAPASMCQYEEIDVAAQRPSQRPRNAPAVRNRHRLRGMDFHNAAEQTKSANAIHGRAGCTVDPSF